jgi:hypothetical protein
MFTTGKGMRSCAAPGSGMSFFEDDEGAGKIELVTDGKMVAGNAFIPYESAQLGMKSKKGLAKRIMGYADAMEAYRMPQARSHCFGKRLLCGKTFCQEQGRLSAAHIFWPFLSGQYAPGEAFAVFFQQARDS